MKNIDLDIRFLQNLIIWVIDMIVVLDLLGTQKSAETLI